jgi:adenylate kinase family enzyme
MLPQTVICIGRSGSGKGTQIKLLQDFLKEKNSSVNTIHIETGVYFREFIQEQGVSAQLSKSVYLDGGRQPDFLAISMWGYVLCKDYTGTENIIFDGTPRSLAEAHIIEDALQFYKRFDGNAFAKPKIVYIDVPEEWSIARMNERGRIDDKKEQENNRMKWFTTEVEPAISFFKHNSHFDFIHIQGDRSVEEVHADVISHFA